ncbi:MAG: sugar ABC transporter permease [Atribacterota bacterium]
MKIKSSLARANGIARMDKVVFLFLPLCLLGAIIIYPTLNLWRLALSNFDITYMREPVFIGVRNFVRILADDYFWSALWNTAVISGTAVAIEFFLGLAIALLLSGEIGGGKISKSLLIIPIMVPPVVVGLNFKLIFDNFGPINDFLRRVGLKPIEWLGSPLSAKISIIIADVWQWTPFVFIILLAGLQTVPPELYDAAKVDGASGWKVFRHITWPMLIPSITIALAFRIIDALKIFDVVYMVTNGGPSFATEVFSLNVYRTAFRFGSLGYASALAVTMFVVLTFVIWMVIRGMNLAKRMEW